LSAIARRCRFAGAALLVVTVIVDVDAAADRNSVSKGSPSAMPSTEAAGTAIEQYCVGCHNDRRKAGDLVLEHADLAQAGTHPEIWEKVIRKLRIGAMPPAGMPSPDAPLREGLISALEARLDAHALARPDPGRTVVHRLNRVEYANAVRDLLAVDIRNLDLLPPDDSGYGFDNVADVLSLSPGLLERYLIAARTIARIALGDPGLRPSVQTYALPYLTLVQEDRMNDDLPPGSRGGLTIQHEFPLDGMYSIRLHLQRHAQAFGSDIRGLAEESQIEVRLDGERVSTFIVGGDTIKRNGGFQPEAADSPSKTADAGLEVRLPISAGVHRISVDLLKRAWAIEGFGPSRLPPASDGFAAVKDTTVGSGKVLSGIDSVDVGGPYGGKVPMDSPSRRRIFVCRPTPDTETVCARRIIASLARRAYRRPVSREEVDDLLGVFQRGRATGTIDTGLQWVLERLLTWPDFLVRIERDPRDAMPGTAYHISDIELASRLSFFLWSSIPDDELLRVAISDRLHDEATLAQQVRRMVQDDRFEAFLTNFFGQWLSLRTAAAQRPDPKAFPDFDENLRDAFLRETSLFLDSQVRGDRPVLELLTANYTFVNERLARHYGIPYVRGSHFRRITYPDDRRAGVLGQGSVLTATSYAHRTSPVVRGAWILTNLLGVPPPPPPANVPPFPENDGHGKPRSVRERMEQHRRNPVCAACHGQMDPIGFALENFDAIGRWRTLDAGVPIDASGTFPGGDIKFAGPAQFRDGMVRLRAAFLSTLTQKLVTYAVGRGVEFSDMPAVRQILRSSASSGEPRWSALLLAVVRSAPFQMRRAER
jgi:hypothetical protein